MSAKRCTPALIARLQKLIDDEKLDNPYQVVRLSQGWGVCLRITQDLFAAGRLKRHPEGEANSTGKIVKSTPENIDWLQNVIDARNYTNPNQLANDPEVMEKCISKNTIRTISHKRKLKFRQDDLPKSGVLRDLLDRYTPEELKMLTAGHMRVVPGAAPVPIVKFTGYWVRVCLMGDTHFGSVYSLDETWQKLVDVCKEQLPDIYAHTGDVTDGMGPRGYASVNNKEIHTIGYHAQRALAVEKLAMLPRANRHGKPAKFYVVRGNHDEWYMKENSADIVGDVCMMLRTQGFDATYLGRHEGDISLNGKAVLKLWHGEDGSSYAVSYRVQKVIESFTGGEKPHVLALGHTHKMIHGFDRHVHYFSTGSIQQQSMWMRMKRLAAHTGFWILDICVNDQGVSAVTSTWYPFYV